MDAAALLGLGLLGWSFLRWHLTVEGETGTTGYGLLFRGGFLIVDMATLLLVVAAMHPGSIIGRRVLGSTPLVWLGKRSYGFYLWHWPVFQLTRPLGDQSVLNATAPDLHVSWLAALAIRLLITVALTEVSYRFLEMPVRNGALGTWWRRHERGPLWRTSVSATVCLPVLALVAVASTISFGATDQLAVDALCNEHPETCGDTAADSSLPESQAVADKDSGDQGSTTTEYGTGEQTGDSTSTSAAGGAAGSTETTTSDTPSTDVRQPSNLRALVIGDSVMLGASGALRRAGLIVDARINRNFSAAASLVVERRRKQQHLEDIVVIGLGTAGGISQAQVTKLMSTLTSVPHVVFITPEAGGRSFESRSRAVLLQTAQDYPNVSIIDWQQIAQPLMKYHQGAPGVSFEDLYFYRDQFHLVSKGRRYFADLILAEVQRLSAP